MTFTEKQLWNSLINFQIDEPGTKLTFAKRLSRENGWSLDYTNRVILEYKKFIFLCAISSTGITPSDPVDQAWHLHLTYTNSYWNKMCKGLLNKEIHHNPTKGGKKENEKFNIFYDSTREMYKSYFNEDQPTDIWHNNEKRFTDINFQRVNLSDFWLFKKPKMFIRFKTMSFIIMLLSLAFVAMSNGSLFLIITSAVILFIFLIWLFNNNDKNNRSNNGSSSSNSSSGCGFFFIGCGSSDSSSSGCGSSGCGSGCSGCGS